MRIAPVLHQKHLLSIVSLALVAGCSDNNTTAPVDVASLQGRWASALASPAVNYTVIVMPAQSGSAQAWALAQDLSQLAKLSITGGETPALTGKSYALSSSGSQSAVTVNSTATAGTTASPKTLNLNGVIATALALTQSEPLSSASVQADLTGNWRASVSAGAQAITWAVGTAGALTGSSTTGCTWSGNLPAQSNITAYRATLTEVCAGVTTNFSGIATLNPAKSLFTVVGTTNDETKGIVLTMAKQP